MFMVPYIFTHQFTDF